MYKPYLGRHVETHVARCGFEVVETSDARNRAARSPKGQKSALTTWIIKSALFLNRNEAGRSGNRLRDEVDEGYQQSC